MADKSISNQTGKGSLATPLFDDSASARARPVEPIQLGAEPVHRNPFKGWRGRISSIPKALGNQTRALVVVVLIGLITGAVGGFLLVKAARGDSQAVVAETLSNEPNAELTANETQNLDAFASELSTAAQTQRTTLKRNTRVRPRSNKPRAYRVAIIR